MQVTLETTVEELLEAYPDIIEVFEGHDIDVDLECDQVMDWPLEDCEDMCRIKDLEQLIADLNAFIIAKEGAGQPA